MPSALPEQNDYYARHRRQQSSMSQNSLPDQLKNSIAAAYSPNRSAVLLPATIYSEPRQETPHSPRPSGTVQSSSAFSQFDGASDNARGGDPDEFYRHYQPQFSQSTGGSLRQGAIWTTGSEQTLQAESARQSSFASATSETRGGTTGRRQSSNFNDHSRAHTNLPGLRARKSSVKNLVAQFDASAIEEVPPLPIHPVSRPASRNVSPIISGVPQFQQLPASRHTPAIDYDQQQYHGNGVPAVYTTQGVPLNLTNTPHISEIQTTRRPLFGEILSGSPQSISLGHGIRDWRLRRGSEGSPVTTTNPVFPLSHGTRQSTRTEEPHKPRDTYDPHVSGPLRPSHRRVNSASPSISTDTFVNTNAYAAPQAPQTPVRHSRTQGSISRIPVSTRINSLSPTTETQSLSKATSSIELRITRASSPITPKRSSPRRKQRSPTHIQSPGKRGKSDGATRGERSPLLRANIIVPPPKVSPPLRSSRPRVPVSNASTAASRARMAEKFNAMQKMNNEKRVGVRRSAKPPELTDIDLKARRLRITQALSRSLEGQDLRGEHDSARRRNFSTSRTASPAVSERSQWTDSGEVRNGVPAILTESGATDSKDEGDILQNSIEDISHEDREYTQNALRAIQNVVAVDDNSNDDSPTLGRGEANFTKQPSPLQTDFLFTQTTLEPSSALTDITVETQGTNIDPEPQSAVYEPALAGKSLLSHVTQMRSQTPTSPNIFFRTDDLSDHGDQESVNLILRDTTYFPDLQDAETGYEATHSDTPASVPAAKPNDRDSWTSSLEDFEGHDEYNSTIEDESASTKDARTDNVVNRPTGYFPDHHPGNEDSMRSTMASDAYTIVNIVLQRHSTNGIVDQQFVDEVYQEVLKNSPYESEGTLNTTQIEQLCLKEIQTREETWRRSIITGRQQAEDAFPKFEETVPAEGDQHDSEKIVNYFEHDQDPLPLPQPAFKKSHRYKSSLDSVEDWADTSPSVSDWMRFAHGDSGSKGVGDEQITPVETVASDTTLTSNHVTSPTAMSPADNQSNEPEEDTDLYGTSSSRKPTQPLLGLAMSRLPSAESSTHGQALIEPPEVPRRITSLSQMGRQPPPVPLSIASTKVASAKTSTEEADSPEQRRLKRRRHVVKELVDTEFTYEKDLRVLCDIYKQTAPAALSDDDIRVLFGNVEQIQVFSKDFLMLLKSVAKPTYIMERPDRKKDKGIDTNGTRPQSSSSTLASKTNENEIPSEEKDKETRVGYAFESSLADMERVYAGYIRNRQAANQRLEAVQKSSSAREWLKECRDNSSDITNAWNLDALLVKPVQRITKYPLLLKELVESTPEDHPDSSFLRRALHEVTEVNIRINDVKKHTELVDQVLNRKRKDSDVRVGISKAFGRRAEKLKQHVGITEMYEDNQYNEVKIHYDNNIVQLMVVGNDCSSYGRAVTKWVTRMVEIASAAEAWVDVGHSNHQEAESRLRQFAMVTRGISTIALPAHIEQLENKVLHPMQQAVDSMNRFKNDPKGLLQKRDKRMIDYAQARNKKEKGERVDKKIVERMEQWEALNTEAKQRMRKLIKATAKLVRTCQVCLIQMQMDWLTLVKTKLSVAMAISLDHLNVDHIKNDWQMDFDFQEASALSLSICNGALLAEAINMVNFQTPSTTINGEDSPRQASFSTKRSISLHSDGSHVHIPDPMPRNTQQTRNQYDNPNERSQLYGSGFSSSRERAASATSNNYGRTHDPSVRNGTNTKHVSASAGLGGVSFGRSEEALSSGPPRLSVDTPSPLIGSLQPDYGVARPPSSSTFFSAVAEPPSHAHKQSTGSSIFSSAMPMSDSPVLDRAPEALNREPDVLFTAASVYEFNIDRSRREAGFPYLTYVPGEIFDIIGERGELWLARNQDDPDQRVGWIWHKHFAKLAA